MGGLHPRARLPAALPRGLVALGDTGRAGERRTSTGMRQGGNHAAESAQRSRALLLFAAANLAAVLANAFNIDGLLRDHGWAVAMQWTFVPRLWAAAAVLLLAGAAFAIAGRLRT
jgi:hypothetical protein